MPGDNWRIIPTNHEHPMARPPKIDRPVRQEIYLPESLHSELTMRLFSSAEHRVPHGAWSKFFETLARQALANLTPAIQGVPE